jgi:hypothetical protein
MPMYGISAPGFQVSSRPLGYAGLSRIAPDQRYCSRLQSLELGPLRASERHDHPTGRIRTYIQEKIKPAREHERERP